MTSPPDPARVDEDTDTPSLGDLELYVKDETGEFVPVQLEESPDGERITVSYEETVEVSKRHSGPLPSVEAFRAYGEVVPDAPERILRMAEKEQDAYHQFMHSGQARQTRIIATGQWMGFIGMMVALGGAIFLATAGHTTVAIALASPAVLIPIMRFYFHGKNETPKE